MGKGRAPLRIVLALAALVGLSAQPLQARGLAAEPISNQFTQPEAVNTAWEIDQAIPAEFERVAENASFQLYANPATLAFKVVDRRSGYVWHSNLNTTTKDDKLNKTWTAFALSGLSIDYLDAKAIRKRASITNTETVIDFQRRADGFQAAVTFSEVGITVAVNVRLGSEGVRVEVPFTGLREANPDYKLGQLHVYPFFGATKEDQVPGYMFIPDGAGSLIRFSAVTKAKNMFYGRYYGVDLGMLAYLPYDPTTNRPYRMSIPVIGMVHGYKQNAYLAIVEHGAPYGEIQAHPAGVITRFNFLYNAFIYNESYFQATNRSGAGVTTLQPAINPVDIALEYRFLTGEASDYVGMARSYQQYLLARNALPPARPATGDIGIRLEFLGAEKERVLFWDRVIPMTTVRQMGAILADLDLPQPEVVYYGWQPLGASAMPPATLRLEGQLGTLAELRAVAAQAVERGGAFALYLDPQAAFLDEPGYSTRNDLAMSITNLNLVGFNRNKVNYYLNDAALRRRFAGLSQATVAELEAGLALDGVGAMLYSDFKRGQALDREAARRSYQALLAESPAPLAFYAPNDYAFGAMRAYYDMPLTTSGYLYATDTVPFLPLVLAGHVPAFGPALNFSSSPEDDLLRHVDYGVYPAYFLSQEATAKILNTRSNWIYSSSYAQWEEEIRAAYAWLNARLGPVQGQPIVARTVPAPGVAVVTYGNGRQILVNYTSQPVTIAGVVVAAKDAVLREAAP